MFLNQYFTNNQELKSEERVIKYYYGSDSFSFISDNGVFSKKKIDFGSKLLIETYLKNENKIDNFLDVGCGYGFLSIVLAKVLNVKGLGIDVNLRAISLAKKNAELNKVSVSFKESNIYDQVLDKYDLIITNPPIRAGKKVVLDILEGAKDYLTDKGQLWFVMRKDQGSESVIKIIRNRYLVEIKAKKKGFFIIVAKKN